MVSAGSLLWLHSAGNSLEHLICLPCDLSLCEVLLLRVPHMARQDSWTSFQHGGRALSDKSHYASIYWASAGIILASIPLAKASHQGKPQISVGRLFTSVGSVVHWGGGTSGTACPSPSSGL